jgi:hypothetical protein
MSQLQRLVLGFRNDEEIVVRCLYRSSLDGPNPTTKTRARVVAELTRSGLRDALEALEGDVEMVGVSGYQVREDILDVALPRPEDVALPRPDEPSEAKAAS